MSKCNGIWSFYTHTVRMRSARKSSGTARACRVNFNAHVRYVWEIEKKTRSSSVHSSQEDSLLPINACIKIYIVQHVMYMYVEAIRTYGHFPLSTLPLLGGGTGRPLH